MPLCQDGHLGLFVRLLEVYGVIEVRKLVDLLASPVGLDRLKHPNLGLVNSEPF